LRVTPPRVQVAADEAPEDAPSAVDQPVVASQPRTDVVPDEIRALAVNIVQPTSPAERPRDVCGIAPRSRAATSPELPGAASEPSPARAPAVAIATPASLPTVAPLVENAVRGESELAQAFTSPTPATATLEAATLTETTTSTTPKTRTRLASSTLAEKIAVPSTNALTPGAAPVVARANNKFLFTDKQLDAEPVPEHGTGNAKSSVDMKSPFESSPRFSAEPSAGVERAIPSVASVQSPGPSAVSAQTFEKPEPEISLHAADAASVVRNVVDLTHEFRMRDRGSVEVKFNFKDATELTVRLAYRNGDVHTTFRTDSSELRAALGKEWAEYAASFAQEGRDYKIADPVFTGSGDFSNAPRDRDAGSSHRDESQARSDFNHSGQSGHGRAAQRQAGVFRSSPAAATAPVPAAATPRISTDRLLHVFA
jgi:hypothetical protein